MNRPVTSLGPRRQDWEEAALRLLRPVMRGQVWPGPASVASPFAMRYEALIRPIWFAGALLAGGRNDEVAAWYREQIEHGLDPTHPRHWDANIVKMDQVIVEISMLAINLVLAREQLWDKLSATTRGRLDTWLALGLANFNCSVNNWNLFPTLIELARKQLGLSHNAAAVADLLADIEKMYRGDGWYADGFYRQFDYYVPWAIYPLLLIAAKWEGGDFERRIHERAAQFARDYELYFDREGRYVPYGRSLSGRAASMFWSACAWAGVPGIEPGLCRELAGRNIGFFLNQPIFDEAGHILPGFAYPNERVNELYISYASPYAFAMNFLLLALPSEHPVWSAPATEAKLPAQKFLPKPNLILTRSSDDRNATMYNGGSHHPFDFGNHAAKYGKFAYSSHFGFNLADAALPSFDNMISLSPDGTTWSHRIRFEICPNQGNWLVSRHQPFAWCPKTVITTALGVFGSWHVRVHLLELEREFLVREGGTPTPDNQEFRSDHGVYLRGEHGGSGIWCLQGDTSPVYRGRQINVNVLYRTVFVPLVEKRLPAGTHRWVSACYADPTGGPVEDVLKKMPSFNADEVKLEPSADRPLHIITGGGRPWPS